MKVGNYVIKFAHQRNNETTHCIIENGDDLTKGVAKCSKRDIFSKDVGRKVALKKAVANLPRQERAKIWEAYRNMTKEPRW